MASEMQFYVSYDYSWLVQPKGSPQRLLTRLLSPYLLVLHSDQHNYANFSESDSLAACLCAPRASDDCFVAAGFGWLLMLRWFGPRLHSDCLFE